MSDWISVKERRPKDRQIVLAWMEKSREMAYAEYDADYVAFLYEDDHAEIMGVTHWMPLPEPPKKEQP